MDADARNVARVVQAHVFPGLAGVFRFPHTVAEGDIAAHGFFAAAHIDDVVVVLRHRHRADGAAEVTVGDVFPGLAAVFGAPHAAAHAAEIEEVGLARHAGYGRRTTAPKRPDAAPLHRLVQRFIKSGCRRYRAAAY